jgi:hypothetical protein
MFVQQFKTIQDIIDHYAAPTDALKGAKLYLAWYGYGDYCGSSIVIFKKDGKLYEVNGSHCSCNGLEGQWEPEETSWSALAKRNWSNDHCEGGGIATAELQKLIKRYA